MTRGKIKTFAWAVSIHSDMSRRWICLPSRFESNAKPSGGVLSVMPSKERGQHGRVGVGLAVSRLPASPGRLRWRIGVRVDHAGVDVVEWRVMGNGSQSSQFGVSRIAALDAGPPADVSKIAWLVFGLGHVFRLATIGIDVTHEDTLIEGRRCCEGSNWRKRRNDEADHEPRVS